MDEVDKEVRPTLAARVKNRAHSKGWAPAPIARDAFITSLSRYETEVAL